MPANIITSGDYSLGLNAGNSFVVTGLISSTGNIAGNYILGNGALLSGVANASSSYLIVNGASNIAIATNNANITMAVANATGNVVTVTNSGMFITGDLTVSGNATLSGNISGDHIDNGTTAIDIAVPNGNANIKVGGVSNIAVFATTGVYVTGVVSATSNVIANNVMATNIVNVASHTGSVVSVTGNVTGGNLLTGGLISSTGNLTGGNILTAGLISATSTVTSAANITGGNVLTGGLISAAGTVTGTSHIGSVVSVTANVTGGNILTGGLISATGNVSGGNVNTATVRNSAGALTVSTGSGSINLSPAANVVLNNTYINGLAQPVQDNDAASKIYVDNAVSTALTYHSPVAAATTTTLATATGGTISYAQPNGAGNGVGATLTTTGTFYLIDTANIQTVGTRVLIKNEANAVFNGVYTYANTTNLVRSTDADQFGADSTEQLSLNDYFFVTGGTVNAGAAFVVSAPTGTITFGTSNISFSQFSSSQTYSANTAAGISLNGTVINALVDNTTTAFDGGGNITVKTSAQLTTPNIGVATGTSLSATGNVQGGNLFTAGSISSTGTISSAANVVASQYFIGNGSQLTGLFIAGSTGGAIVSGTSNVRVALDANTTVGVAGNTVAEFANTGAYITGLISATGNVSAPYFVGNGSQLTGLSSSKIYNGTSEANIGAANGNANITIGGTSNVVVISTAGMYVTGLSSTTGNVVPGNVTTAGLITAAGNVQGGNLVTGGQVTATGNIEGGNLLTGALVSATTVVAAGNVTGGNILTGGLISATSSMTAAANITGGNILTAGLISATANVTGGNIRTAGLVSATGNVTGNYILGNGALLTGVITSVANINNGTSNVTVVSSGGNVTVGVGGTGNVAVWATTGEYITGLISASGNITGGNILTGGLISATGNISGGNLIATANVLGNGYARFTGSFDEAQASTAGLYLGYAGGTPRMMFGTGNTLQTFEIDNDGGNLRFYQPGSTKATLTPTGNWSVVGNVIGGNLLTGGLISATSTITSAANVSGGNILTAGLISASGNITGGNILTIGLMSASGSITTLANLSAVGNVVASGSVLASALISATGNVTGGNILTGGLISATSSITGGTGLFGTTTNSVYDSVGVGRAGVFAASNTSTTINSSTAALAIVNNDTTANNWAQLNFAAVTGASTNQYSSGIIAVQFGARTNGQYPTGVMTFSTSSSLNSAPSEKMRITSAGTLNVNVANTATAIDNAAANGVGNIGSATTYFNTVFAKATSAQYADLAEMYTADANYEPGTVVIFGGTEEVTRADQPNDRRVAGVISTNPSYLMNSTQQGEFVVPVAMTGRVPCLVTGTIHKGDLMVTAGNGHASANNMAATGTVIGKALQDYDGESGMIEVVVGRV